MLEWTGERYLPWLEEAQMGYEHLHRYAFASQFVQGKRVLDLACGEGYGSDLLAETACSVLGLDLCEETVDHAREKYGSKNNLSFQLGSILDVPIEGKHVFDVIVCYEAIEHVEDHSRLLSEVKRLLKPEGLFIISSPNRRLYSDEPNHQNTYHLHELYYEEFRELLQKDFRQTQFLGQKIYCGSQIWPMNSGNSDGLRDSYIERHEDAFNFVKDGKRDPLYFLAMASDAQMDFRIDSSILVDISNQLQKQKEREIRRLQEAIDVMDQHISRLENVVKTFLNSMSWRLTAPLRWIHSRCVGLLNFVRQSASSRRVLGNIAPQRIDPYEAWQRVNAWHDASREHLTHRLERLIGCLPRISVVMPCYNAPLKFLEKSISSVVNQVYEDWELCIADDCSTDKEVIKALKRWERRDSRIKVDFRKVNGNISASTNTAASLAKGDFLLFLDQDDELSLDALGEVALYIAENPETDYLYTDDDKIGIKGERYDAQFKPGWSPELLLSYMYFSHLCVVRRTLYEKTGGMRIGFEGCQDFDFALRATELARHVGHIPMMLYHWRAIPGSVAHSVSVKPARFDAARRALQEAMDRRNVKATAIQAEWAAKSGLGIYELVFPDEGPSVTIIIPSKDNLSFLKSCLSSLQKTTYKNYEILIIDNDSEDAETVCYLKEVPHKVVRISSKVEGFSYAFINNQAAQRVNSEYLLFLNDDTEVINPRWLSQMVGYAQFDGVGAVGAKLLYPDGKVQHAGVLHGLHHGLAGHAFRNSSHTDAGYLRLLQVTRNCSAVTAACLLTPRKLFQSMGGFDENCFAVAYNDVDYCYRLSDEGFRSVYCPQAELIHHEGVSRPSHDSPIELINFKSKYSSKRDKYYSPHLTLMDESFRIQPRKLSRDDSCKRVLMCCHMLNLTGAPLVLSELAINLSMKGGVVKPVIFSTIDGPLRETYERNGIEVFICDEPLKGMSLEENYDAIVEAICKVINKLDIDLIFANTFSNFFMIECAKRVKIPSVWTIHEFRSSLSYSDVIRSKNGAHALKCFSDPYRVVFVSDATCAGYLPLNTHHNFTVIHNGLERTGINKAIAEWPRSKARTTLEANHGEVVILLVGTVYEQKGQHDLPMALSKLPEHLQHKLRCYILGDRVCEYSNQLKSIIKSLPGTLRERVKVIPETRETGCYYRAADIFVCTSRFESYPRVILEAMAFNLPIVTTCVGGIKEQVREGINALFYEPGNIEELAKKLERLISDDVLRGNMTKNSSLVLNTLDDFEKMTTSYSDLFKEACSSKPR